MAVFLLLLSAGYVLVFELIVPKASIIFAPAKWQNIPLGEKRQIIYDYIGMPGQQAKDGDTWEAHLKKNKKYILHISYKGDSTAVSCKLSYAVKLFWIEKITLIKSDSLSTIAR